MSLILIGGGVRSGKSAFAERRAIELGERRAFIATAEALDEEMRHRIERHRADRGADFETFEASRDLLGALEATASCDVVLIDCLTMWVSNLLLDGLDDDALEGAIEALASRLAEATIPILLVSNEVGMGVVPDNALGRRFRDHVGRAHQRLSPLADEVYFAAMGTLLRLKPLPVEPAR